MMTLILVELLAVVVATGAFVVLYAWRSRWWASPTGRLVMTWAVISLAEAGLFSLSYVVPIPIWVFAIVFGATALLAVRRLWLLLQAQRRTKTEEKAVDKGKVWRRLADVWWRLVHLEPLVLRGALTGAVGLAGALGILGWEWLPDAVLKAWVPLMILVQVLVSRPGVTANARVAVAVPDPVNRPDIVVPGDAVTTASSTAIIMAAEATPEQWPAD